MGCRAIIIMMIIIIIIIIIKNSVPTSQEISCV
jgi:hypothetical protein